MRLVYAEEMQALDRYTIEEMGIPGEILMENAGRGIAELIWSRLAPKAQKGTLIVCGPGNNGGDGFVIARHLAQKNIPVKVITLVPPEKYKGEAALNLQILKRIGLPLIELTESDLDSLPFLLKHFGLIVDAIFGTGLKRPVSGFLARVVEILNSSDVFILAVDMPSGLSADTGHPLGLAVKADLTATMALPKVGQVIYPGRQYVGELCVVDISMPPQVIAEKGPKRLWLTEDWALKHIGPREPDTHKGTYGHLLIIAGSPGKTGAAILAAKGALRAGAGLVTLASTRSTNLVFENSLIEAMTTPIGEETAEGCLSLEAFEALSNIAEGKRAAVVGPGVGLTASTMSLVQRLVAELPLPMVVDADALTALSGQFYHLRRAQYPRVLTPHPGELARLLQSPKETIQKDRLLAARTAARETNTVVVLKGAATVIASPDGREAVNSTGNPGMASGGMGDVLAGIIGAFLAQGRDPFEAACLGVYIHGAAGDLLAAEKGPWGFLASELVEKVPVVFKKLVFKRTL